MGELIRGVKLSGAVVIFKILIGKVIPFLRWKNVSFNLQDILGNLRLGVFLLSLTSGSKLLYQELLKRKINKKISSFLAGFLAALSIYLMDSESLKITLALQIFLRSMYFYFHKYLNNENAPTYKLHDGVIGFAIYITWFFFCLSNHGDLLLASEKWDFWVSKTKENEWLFLLMMRKMNGDRLFPVDARKTMFPEWA